MVGTRHIVGLAIDDGGIFATELHIRAGRPEVRHCGEFSWEGEWTAENAKDQGQRLHKFLREHGFTAKRAVVGLAAKWVLAKEVEAPPASPEALAGILGIQAERAFSMSASELVFDYCGRTSASQKSQVLLLATRRQVIDQVKDLAQAAGLQVESITVSAFACCRASSEKGSAYRYGLYTRPTYCEFWGQFDGSPRFLKHIAMVLDGNPSACTDVLGSTIQRQILLSPRQDQSPSHHVAAFDACGLPTEVFDRLNERLGPQITVGKGPSAMPAGTGSGDPMEARAVAATAVAWTAVEPDGAVVDFLSPRIGEKSKKAADQRVLVWAIAVAAVSLIVLAFWFARWQADKNDVAEYKQQLEVLKADIAEARDVVERLSYARKWGDTDPRFLRCLRDLTEAFPEEGIVWATSLALNDSGAGSVVGKTSSDASFYEVWDKINAIEAFSDVKMVHYRDVGRNSREKEFAVNFTFSKGAK
ncbi:MAG TPA: pilus assembly protein PilM [Sedimentisphaerales bacterium]|nr:pilus assembly protein PilM [Sedimentisphaerales bacterium]HNU29148.1 pilus assembly protein PilM [Sedimentisphaerales bacterium]